MVPSTFIKADKDIVDDVRAAGGRLSIEDFQNYAATIGIP